MSSDELMKRSNAGALIQRAVGVMISVEAMQSKTAAMVGQEFPLVSSRGRGRVVAADDHRLSLLVRGLRADYTWDRLATTWRRLLDNHTLDVDELGGGHDAVGIVSFFAVLWPDGLDVIDDDGLLVLKDRVDSPIHQYADMDLPTAWPQWRRHIHG